MSLYMDVDNTSIYVYMCVQTGFVHLYIYICVYIYIFVGVMKMENIVIECESNQHLLHSRSVV